MRKNCKDGFLAEIHKDPEIASMTAKRLATIVDADQTTISAWRRRMKEIVGNFPKRGEDKLIKAYEASRGSVEWESLAKKLQAALAAQIKETQGLEELIAAHQKRIYELESRSWLSRLFNLKG